MPRAPRGALLAELSALVDSGQLSLRLAGRLPVADVAAAHQRLAAGGCGGAWCWSPEADAPRPPCWPTPRSRIHVLTDADWSS
ncbi:hypothetical protein AB0A95_32430 [Micromonospora sp. NPDC049230]|uniref:hypothetical protein n=1 Tax=Micromonospora sp. NPDC049230 TaxID=3155502 RepID=UPI0033D8823C